MKKIFPLIVASIFVLSGFGAVALTDEKQIEIEPQNIQDWALEIKVESMFLGYVVTYTNVGNENITGDYKINITTDALVRVAGEELGRELKNFTLEASYKIRPFLRPVIGFGPATINIEGVFTHEDDGEYPFGAEIKGFVFLFYVIFGEPKFNIP